jgi:hypothetical protein
MELVERRAALDEFYGQLAALEAAVGGKRILSECDGRMDWPQRGVYFFFEDGQFREDGITPRVTRVGTHALRPSRSTLWGRLSQHKGNVGGLMPGGGNHRGSIFRLHVGTALLTTGDWPDLVRASWGSGSTAKGDIRELEYPLEAAVSRHIGAMPFLWVAVGDEPNNCSARGVIEAGAISLLSNLGGPVVDSPTGSWLGHRADRYAVRSSGLWNVDYVRKAPTIEFLETLSNHIRNQL